LVAAPIVPLDAQEVELVLPLIETEQTCRSPFGKATLQSGVEAESQLTLVGLICVPSGRVNVCWRTSFAGASALLWAASIFLDVFNVLLFILQLLGGGNRRRPDAGNRATTTISRHRRTPASGDATKCT
jgi:hypothetical protein